MNQPSVIFTIDPGIDIAAVAIWKPEFAKPDLFGAAHALVEVRSLRTKTEMSTVERAASLGRALQYLCSFAAPAIVFIEKPPTWHVKTREKLSYRNVIEARDKLQVAVGALAAACGIAGIEVREIDASRMRQAKRFDYAEKACNLAGKKPPKNDDERSAVWIGLEVISAGLHRPALSATGT